MVCLTVEGVRPPCHQHLLPLLLLLLVLLSATLAGDQQTVTALEELEEEILETTTLFPEQQEVAFGFIYSKEFRVRARQL